MQAFTAKLVVTDSDQLISISTKETFAHLVTIVQQDRMSQELVQWVIIQMLSVSKLIQNVLSVKTVCIVLTLEC